jgi:hypothetical protein
LTVAAPASVAGVEKVYASAQIPPDAKSPSDPIFGWMGDNIDEASVVLAPDSVNISIPAYSAHANVVSLRGAKVLKHLAALNKRAPGQIDVPQGARDTRTFYSRSSLEEKINIVQRNEVDYVLTLAGSGLDRKLENHPGFAVLDTAGERYDLYAVNRSKLSR